jgi:hypothetical protein
VKEANVPSNYADAMLRHVLEETKRALATQDAIGRVDMLAGVIQPYAGWALRWAIEDARAQGHTWATIAGIVGRPYPTILRQLQAGGPIYARHPAQSPTSGNFDAQTPLRRAATELAQRMAALAMRDPNTVTNIHLRDRILRLSDTQGVINDPVPLLEATRVVLAGANGIRGRVPSRDAMSEWERGVWDVLDELGACYQRDKREIETAHQVMADAGMLPDVGG